MNWLMLSCKKATELIEKKSLVGVSWIETIRLQMHTTMCKGCSSYQKQSLLIDKLLNHHIKAGSAEQIPEIANESLKDRIIASLPTD